MKPLRLLAIIEASGITGPAKNLLQFAALARSARFTPPLETTVAAFRRPGESDLFAKAVQSAGLRMIEIPEKGRFDTSVLAALRELAGTVNPDVIQTHAVKSHFLVRMAGLHRRVPWVAFHHGYTWPAFRVRLYNQLDRWSLRAAVRVLTVSAAFKRELVRIGIPGERIGVIHNAIDPEWGAQSRTPAAKAAVREQLEIPPDSRIVLTVGRLSREKDHLTLLRAFAELRREHPALPAHLVIVGDGPERPHIEEAIRQLGLGGVVLTGQQPSAEPYYGVADVVVISSLSEGSPNALLEAMAARVPVVATAVGGVPEIVQEGKGALLVQPGDAHGMAGAIASVLLDPPMAGRLTETAHRAIIERHSPDARTRQLCAAYGALRPAGR